MKELKEQLFEKCAEEAAKYLILPDGSIMTEDPFEAMKKDHEKTVARQRFSALYDLIIDADLDCEYDEYVERHPHVIQYRTPSNEPGIFNVICICPQKESYVEFFQIARRTVLMESISYDRFVSLSKMCNDPNSNWKWDEGLY